MNAAPWILLFGPLVAALIILLIGRYSKPLSAGLAILGAALSCLMAWWIFAEGKDAQVTGFHWLDFRPAFSVPFGFVIDQLSRTMMVIVTTIATIVFTYSIGYMKAEEGYSRYFAALSLFLFSMLGIVLADNFLMMFIFWELVGVSSYILIGHYFGKDSAADAGKQAFIVNRIGDFGFMVGILMFWFATGTLVFSEIEAAMGGFGAAPIFLAAACLCVFCGTIGKSAQMPLHVWLPNSMEGPTPVSSLLHAATMVAAGVYMLCRIFPILGYSALALNVIAWVGAITCFVAGLMATQQDDIKRVLAYSTISQLGYMVLGVGVAPSPDVPMFHLFTHACFKCLLFLCAGSVIIGMHHEQNIWKMGALKNKMPVTFLTMAIGSAALSGVPFFSGSFSKDLIIAWAYEKSQPLFWISAGAVLLTAFYVTRMFVVTFFGAPRSDAARHAHESPAVMIVPLCILAVPSALAGYHWFIKYFLTPPEPAHPAHIVHYAVLAFLAVGIVLAFLLYRNASKEPLGIKFFERRLYIDDLYAWLVKVCQDRFSGILAFVDRVVIGGGTVTLPSFMARTVGFVLSLLQLGNLQAYALFFGAGVVALIWFFIRS